jgi:hypothetical protein
MRKNNLIFSEEWDIGEKKTPPGIHEGSQRGKRRKTMYSFPPTNIRQTHMISTKVKPVFCSGNDSIFGIKD